MTETRSTRARTLATGTFVRSTKGSQSLERGLALLRAFRTGTLALSNAELAERCQLPRPTVSRLTRSLVDAGFLVFDTREKAYRLSAACLSMALAFRTSETTLQIALPFMRQLAESRQVNVGLAVVDALEVVYLESVRLSRIGAFRRIVPGSRIPLAETALGCAWLAGLPEAERRALLARLRSLHGRGWPQLQGQVRDALASVRDHGFCRALWQPGLTSVATPIRSPSGSLYSLNVSFPIPPSGEDECVQLHANLLLELAKDIQEELGARNATRAP